MLAQKGGTSAGAGQQPPQVGVGCLPGKDSVAVNMRLTILEVAFSLDLPNCEKDWQQLHKAACLQSLLQASLLNCGPCWSPHRALALTEDSKLCAG